MKPTQIARKTLEAHFKRQKFEIPQNIKEKYKEKEACFVTLTKNKNLRGCIGSLEPRQELWKDIQENAINAAINDPRFPQVTEYELKDIKIEVSILSNPKKIEFSTPAELLNKINKSMGLVLEKSFHKATFLPQVWKQIPNKQQFLENLSIKAGLNPDAWKSSKIFYYTVKVEEES